MRAVNLLPPELVQEGVVPCQTCGKPHNEYRERAGESACSWKSREDGHTYRPMSAEALCRVPAVAALIRSSIERGNALAIFRDGAPLIS